MAKVTVAALARSSGLAGVASVWQILSRIILTPIILASLGLEGYGVWILLFSLGGSVNFIGVSFGLAYAKLTAEHDSRGDYDALGRLVAAGIVLVFVVGGVGLGALALFRDPILTAIGVPEPMVASAGTALLLVTLAMLLAMSVGCVYFILAGLQRTDLRFTAIIISSVVYFALATLLLSLGWGLVGLATAFLVGEIVAISLAWRWCKRLCPQLRVPLLQASMDGVRKIASLGGRFQALYFIGYLNTQGFKVLLSVLMGPAMVGVLEIAIKLIRLSDSGSSAVQAPMMPAFTNLYTTGERDRVTNMVRQSARALFVVSMICFGYVAVFADRAILLWTGSGYEGAAMTNELAAWTIRVVAAAWVFKQVTGSLSASTRAREQFKLEIHTGLIGVAVQFLGALALYPLFGYAGFISAWIASLLATTFYFLWHFTKQEEMRLVPFLREAVFAPAFVIVPVVIVAALASQGVLGPVVEGTDRMRTLLDLFLAGLAYTAAAGLATWLFVLGADERKALKATVDKLWPSRRAAA